MQTGRISAATRNLGYLAFLAVGLALGVAIPTQAETVASAITAACTELEAAPAVETESAVPPSRGLPGEPY